MLKSPNRIQVLPGDIKLHRIFSKDSRNTGREALGLRYITPYITGVLSGQVSRNRVSKLFS